MVFIEKLKYQERSKMATRVQKHMVWAPWFQNLMETLSHTCRK
jgi:hypothetical protein